MITREIKKLGFKFSAREDLTEYGNFWEYQKLQTAAKYMGEDGRIFPFYFAPVIVAFDSARKILPMRYQVFPSDPRYKSDPKNLSLFNARKDTLLKDGGLWKNLFGKNHGLLAFECFYEWVEVKDLVQAGVVTLKEVKEFFEKTELRKKTRALENGKKYKPSKTALLNPMERKIEISFSPGKDFMWAPVIYDIRRVDNFDMYSFALLTDDPPPEVQAAGHDRCPIFIKEENIDAWLNPQGKSNQELMNILSDLEPAYFKHSLPKAA